MNIKYATLEDIETIVSLRTLQLLDEEKQNGTTHQASEDYINHLRRYLIDQFKHDRFTQVFLIENEEIIATGALNWVDLPPSFTNPSGYLGYITNIYTAVNHRKKGYAFKILNLLKDKAQNLGIQTLFLGASQSGQIVYEKFGFKEIDWYRYDIE